MKNFFQRTIAHNSGDWFWISLILLFSFLFFSSFFTPSVETAAVPTVINYQGKLLQNNLLATTTKSMGFLIYDASSGGSLLYTAAGTLVVTSTINVTPTQGIFSVDLGGSGTNALNTSTFSNNSNLYLEVWIEGTPLSPRKRLTATPFAINSQLLLGISATTTSSGVYIPHSDSNGNFQFTGTPQSSAVSGGVIYVNPGSADADETLFGLAVAGTEKFRVDAEGDVWISGTSTIQNINVLDGIVLGGVKRSSWPAGGGDVTAAGDNSFTGLNTFSATTTFSSTTVNGLLNVGNGALYVDTLTGKVGINSSTPNFNFSVEGESYFHGTTTFQGPLVSTGKIVSPTLKSLVDTGVDDAFEVVVEGDYAYVANGTDGLVIVDISNKSVPVVLSTLDASSVDPATSLGLAGDYVYLLNGLVMDIIDVSNPKNPTLVSTVSYGPGQQLQNVVISGNYAYLSRAADGIDVIDISDASRPLIRSNFDPGANLMTNLVLSGRYLYVVTGGGPIYIIDITNPANLSLVSSLDPAANINNLFVSGKYLYVSTDANGLIIYDISDVRSPVFAGTLSYIIQAVGVIVGGDYAYFQLSDSLRIVDVSDKASPREVASINSSGVASWSLDVVGNYFYGGTDVGLEIVDVTGIKSSNVGIGMAEIEKVQVRGSAEFGQNIRVKGGATLGGGLQLNGDLGFGMPTSTDTGRNRIRFSDGADFFSNASTSVSNLFVFDTYNAFSEAVSSTLLLSIRNGGTPMFSVASNGDVAASGTLYAGSATIGTPGSPGDLAERVDIASDDMVEPGDVVVVDSNGTDTYRRSSVPYEQGVAGVISTNPSLVIGYGKTQNTAVMAMVGRVPIKVSTENGPIVRGDILVTASSTGYAMRYDATKDDDSKVVGIVGVALESLDEGSGKIMGLVRTGWVNSRHKTIADIQQELVELAEAQNVSGGDANILNVGENGGQLTFLAGDINANGFSILNIKRLVGNNGMWEVDEEGRFISRLETSEGRKSLYSMQSDENEYIFSGSSHLQLGVARVDFDPLVKEIIDGEKPMKINITLTSEALGVFISAKDATGFVVKELQNGQSNAEFDYVVIAKRKGKNDVANQPEVQPQGGNADQPPADENPPAQDDNANQPQNDAPAGDGQEAPPQDAPADNQPEPQVEQPSSPPPEEAPADNAPPVDPPPAES